MLLLLLVATFDVVDFNDDDVPTIDQCTKISQI